MSPIKIQTVFNECLSIFKFLPRIGLTSQKLSNYRLYFKYIMYIFKIEKIGLIFKISYFWWIYVIKETIIINLVKGDIKKIILKNYDI